MFFDNYSLSEISEYTNKHWTTISYHLKKLIKADIVEEVRIDNERKYGLKDIDYIVRIFYMYFFWRERVNKEGKLEYIITYSALDEIVNNIYDTIPIPFCAGFSTLD